MKMTNLEIYNIAQSINEVFQDTTQYLPIKVNFYIQKNKALLTSLAQTIEMSRWDIIKNYGELDTENERYIIPAEKMEEAQKELSDLFSLEQEVEIYKVDIEKFPDDINLTTGQMEALMFMIN